MTGEELKAWRQGAGLTQSELGRLTNMSLSTVQAMEKGPAALRLDQELVVDMASLRLAAARREPGVLTAGASAILRSLKSYVSNLIDEEDAALPVETNWQGGPENLRPYLVEIRKEVPRIRVEGRLMNYDRIWEISIITSSDVVIIGSWGSGDRPPTEDVGKMILEAAGKVLYYRGRPESFADTSWQEASEPAKEFFRSLAQTSGV